MKKALIFIFTLALFFTVSAQGKNLSVCEHSYQTSLGKINIVLIGHGSLRIDFQDKDDVKHIYIDPYSAVGDYETMPKADLILLTHEHADHLDQSAINAIKKENTKFVVSESCNQILGYGTAISNGESFFFHNIDIEAVPAYNIKNVKPDGEAYHPKGRGNGYILIFQDFRVYVAADTENIPEMDSLKGTIDVAFLPKNLPYTMTDEMFVDAAKKISPKYLYPYHFSEFNKDKIEKELQDTGIQLIVCPMSSKIK